MSLCECGCGVDAGVYAATDRRCGRIKGQPKRFINGHQAKLASAAFHVLPKVHKPYCPRGHERKPENMNSGGACKICVNLRLQENRLPNHCIHGHEKNPENTTKTGACKACTVVHMKRRYGLSSEQFETLLENQENQCAICHIDFSEDCKPCIDHKHDGSVNVRGLLCVTCNTGLGSFKDNIVMLESAIQYLEKTQCNQFIQ